MKSVLVTGGAGFIGSHFLKMMTHHYPHYYFVNLDLLTYAGSLKNIRELENLSNYLFVHGDIGDKELVDKMFEKENFDWVINFAAESHVDRSIQNPRSFLETNVLGTQVLLDVAKKYWQIDHNDKQSHLYRPGVVFLQISTDEVYGSLKESGTFDEESPLLPNSPYAASKASSDLIVRSYYKTYGLPILITRCSNNYGPNQHLEKFIPVVITQAMKDQKIPIYGDGQQIRDWIYVKDHCHALDSVLHQGMVGEVYNISANQELKNIKLAEKILDYLGKPRDLINYVTDRLGHDYRYSMSHQKISQSLGWQSKCHFEQGLKETINWYIGEILNRGYDENF